jgi:hypothetical protein
VIRTIVLLFCIGVFARTSALAGDNAASPTIDLGYRQMYNLQFPAAHDTFHRWEQLHPEDPLGPTSDAAAYLFSEFDRLGILQTELFTNDESFKKLKKLSADPAAKQSFNVALDSSDAVADHLLSKAPNDPNALFAKVLTLGLRGDYMALIEKHEFQSLGYMKRAGVLAEQLLAADPSYYDAYLAVGVENYLLGITAAPVRWMLRLYGAQTDKANGIAKLRLTAEKGRYLSPYARLLLAVAAIRDKDQPYAKELLQGLASEFPNNTLYSKELGKLP